MSPLQNTLQTGQPRARGIFSGQVISNIPLCPEHYRIRMGVENFPPTRPGQFINIRCCTTESVGWDEVPPLADQEKVGLRFASSQPTDSPPHLSQAETAGRVPLLRRPFSLAGRRDAPDNSVELDILYRIVGAGTDWLAQQQSGSEIDILGPLGNGFTIRDDKPQAAVIGGGTGIGPMIYLGRTLAAAGKSVSAFAGARTASALPLTEEQKGTFTITTDDGSLGQAGMVHQAFKNWLEREKPNPSDLTVYACGPEPMTKAIAEICLATGIECQLAMERHMACGMGVCQGCAIKVKTDEPPGWKFKLVCKDGPVFDANELLWE